MPGSPGHSFARSTRVHSGCDDVRTDRTFVAAPSVGAITSSEVDAGTHSTGVGKCIAGDRETLIRFRHGDWLERCHTGSGNLSQ